MGADDQMSCADLCLNMSIQAILKGAWALHLHVRHWALGSFESMLAGNRKASAHLFQD